MLKQEVSGGRFCCSITKDVHAGRAPPALLELHHMQSLVFFKGVNLSWKAFYTFSSRSRCNILLERHFLSRPNICANLAASASSANVGLDLGAQTQATSLGNGCVREGAFKLKLSRDDEELLQKAIAYEAERGFPNSMGRRKRFSEFLASKLYALSHANSSYNDIMLSMLSDRAQSYDNMDVVDRVSLLNKVCSLLGFKCVEDFLDHHTALTEASKGLQMSGGLPEHMMDSRHTQRTLDLQKMSHPAIVFGSSEPIELFNGRPMTFPSLARDAASIEGPQMASTHVQAEVKVKNKLSLQVGKALSSTSSTDVSKTSKKRAKKGKAGETYENWLLNKPISLIEGLSPSACNQLEENGFYTVRKLLQHYPRNYINFLEGGQAMEVEEGQFLRFSGKIIACSGRSAKGLGILQVLIASQRSPSSTGETKPRGGRSDTITLHVKKFFRGARYTSQWFLKKMEEKYPVGAYVAVSGKVKALEQENHFEVKDYNLEVVTSRHTDTKKETVHPVYPSKGGLDAKFFELCIQKVLQDLPVGIDPLPEKYQIAHGLLELREAYFAIHSPETLEVAEKARQRFVFDEFLYLQLGLLLQKEGLASDSHLSSEGLQCRFDQGGVGTLPIEKWAPLTARMLEHLPFNLTPSQLKSVSEIIWDLQRPVPMRRLLQGDVGCGKTVVAFLALLEVVDAGFQGVLMGPSEFLVNQQYKRFLTFLDRLDEKNSRPRIALLSRSVPSCKARAIRKGLESGEIQLAVGTHSLISPYVNFASLGLVVIDEQHRFGVEQRIRLQNKGPELPCAEDPNGQKGPARRQPHFLCMTATPIPRTLSFALYGDMDISKITDLPPGRTPVKTIAMLNNDLGLNATYEMIDKDLAGGGRVFFVFTIIEESEELPNLKAATAEYQKLVDHFKGYTCGLVHGRLKQGEKEQAMSDFLCGKSQLLVATTIIEVGIDIPEASMMVVMDAERHGIAQLHQLRGRVGRGTRQSTCVLLVSTERALERVKVLEASNDGFFLAEMDLKQRGPGDMLGLKQSGHLAEFSLARLSQDGDLMLQARRTAEEILHEHCGLEGLPQLKQELSFRQGLDSLAL